MKATMMFEGHAFGREMFEQILFAETEHKKE